MPPCRPNPLARSSSAESAAGDDLEAQLAQLPELRPRQMEPAATHGHAAFAASPAAPVGGCLAAAAQVPGTGSLLGGEPALSLGTLPGAVLLAAPASQPASPSSAAIPGALPGPHALSAGGVHRRRTFTGE